MIGAREALGVKTKVVGVVAENAAAYALSYEAGKPIHRDRYDPCRRDRPVACRIRERSTLLTNTQSESCKCRRERFEWPCVTTLLIPITLRRGPVQPLSRRF
jgi:hypothetical protein